MNHVLTPQSPITEAIRTFYERAIQDLLDDLKDLTFRPGLLVRLSQPVPECALIPWLKANPWASRYYWKNRNHTMALAAVGDCLVVEAKTVEQQQPLFAKMMQIVSNSDAGFMGGQSFNGKSGTDVWTTFPALRYILPSIELRQVHGSNTLYLNLFADTETQWDAQLRQMQRLLRQLRFPTASTLQTVKNNIQSRSNSVTETQWHQVVRKALDGINSGALQKIVLAREVDLDMDSPVDPFDLLSAWQQRTPNSFSFLFDFADGTFLGCSPERLLSRRKDSISTESLAGTTRRGVTPAEDFRLGQLLLEDPKLCHEHALVSQFVTEKITPFVTELQIGDSSGIFKLDRIQHRYLPVKARLKPDVSDTDLLEQLHPTPAVGGLPQATAQAYLNNHEGFDRGWYSGVVGVFSEQNADFVVAIRSALVKAQNVRCYSGVGIVDGSVSEDEWLELESKIESLLSALTGQH